VTDAELARLLLVVAKRLEDNLQPSSGGLVRHPAGSDGQRRERELRSRRDTGSAYQNHA
jgi:hypothetical protein